MSKFVIERYIDGQFDGVVRFTPGQVQATHRPDGGEPVEASLFDGMDVEDWVEALSEDESTRITYQSVAHRPA